MFCLKFSVKYIIICGAAVSSFFALWCLYFVLMLPKSDNGIEVLYIINELGLYAERSLVLSVITAASVEAYDKMKKRKDLLR